MTSPRRLVGALVIGAGTAGLRAAETLTEAGVLVTLAEAGPSAGRKLLVAGRGGLNLTHSEPAETFRTRYLGGEQRWPDLLAEFGPDQVRAWVTSLGIETYVGSSGRVFPVGNRAASLLRRWLARLDEQGVTRLHEHRFVDLGEDGGVRLETPEGPQVLVPQATVLALGGGSYAWTGSDAAWVPVLRSLGVQVTPLEASNCGFEVDWPEEFRDAYEGTPVKNVALGFGDRQVRGDLMVTRYGLEGGPVYQLSAALRRALPATVRVDLKPDVTEARLVEKLARFRGKGSLVRRAAVAFRLGKAARALLSLEPDGDAATLARRAKALPLVLQRPRPVEEAISSAGGVALDELDEWLMLRRRPGVFVAGEMLDWDAPTGGYLLTGCLATGHRAGRGAARWCLGQSREAAGSTPASS